MAIKGIAEAKSILKKADIKLPFEVGYEEWNKRRDNPAPAPDKILEERAKEASEKEIENLLKVAESATKKAEKLAEKPKEEKK